MNRQRLIQFGLIAMATGILSCAKPPPPQGIDDLYSGLSERLPRIDPTILHGRTIIVDPGHGGHFDGTLGQNGLREASVNLGVSLYLWGLLREAGADAHLTRSAERDFLTEADSSVASDLATRVALVDSLEPDILVSIHHNAQSERDPTTNSTETYYRFGDPGSRDLAFAVHRHLMRNLGIDTGEVRPGNYYILRNVDVPAILGESSYLTHPDVEKHLRLSEKQKLEAEAYFLGILDYFSRGTPKLTALSPVAVRLEDIPTLRIRVDDIGGLGADPGGIDLRINGEPVDPTLDAEGRVVRYAMPWDSPNGPYEARLSVRNILGNTSPVYRDTFELDLPPVTATFDRNPERFPPSGGTVRVRARLLDRRGLSIADGTPVTIETSTTAAPQSAAVKDGYVEFPVASPSGGSGARVAVSARGMTFEATVDRSTDALPAFRRIVIADAQRHAPLFHATVLYGDSLVATGSHHGTYYLPLSMATDVVTIQANGYRPYHLDQSALIVAEGDTISLTPWFDGRLIGKRFLIDPEGGFGSDPGMGQLGLSGPHANLQVARYLGEYVKAAGAEAELSRRNEETLTPRDVVALTNRFGADRYIEIRHRNTGADTVLTVNAYFFPGSRGGSAMAEAVQSAVAQTLGLAVHSPTDQATFPLQQTACPAIVVDFPSIGAIEEELRLGEPGYQRLQAYGILQGILRHFGHESDGSIRVECGEDSTRANWLVTLDETWRLLTPASGTVEFTGLEAGEYTVQLRRRGARHHMVVTLGPDEHKTVRIPQTTTP